MRDGPARGFVVRRRGGSIWRNARGRFYHLVASRHDGRRRSRGVLRSRSAPMSGAEHRRRSGGAAPCRGAAGRDGHGVVPDVDDPAAAGVPRIATFAPLAAIVVSASAILLYAASYKRLTRLALEGIGESNARKP